MKHESHATSSPDSAFATAATAARWPARMQRLTPGPLHALLPAGAEIWLDGGHNEAAAQSVSATLAQVANGHAHHDPADLASTARALGIATTGIAPDVPTALASLHTTDAPVVLILGSLYLAGEVLRENDELPD